MSLPYLFTAPIRTERLVIRPMTPADADDVYSYQSREDVCRYLLHGPRTREEVTDMVTLYAAADHLAAEGDWIEPALELDGRVIGHLYLKLADLENRGAEIGWTMHPDFFGRGYATEGALALLELCFGELGLHRVRAELHPENTASIALCRRLGMREEAHFVKDLWNKAAWEDTGIWAVLDEEWAARLT